MADEQVAVSSTADETQETPSLDTFTDEQRATWLRDGTTPEPPAKPAEAPKAESSETKTEEKPANVETRLESEPGKPQEPKPGEKRKSQLADEIQQLLRQRAEIRRDLERAQAERGVKPTESPAEPKAGAGLKKPRAEDYADKTWEEYEAARDKYYEDLAEAKAKAAVEADRRERQAEAQRQVHQKRNQEIESNWSKRSSEYRKNHPEAKDFDAAIRAMVESELIPENSYLDQWILNSDNGPALAYHFATNPDDILRIGELTAIAASRELAKLELSLGTKTPAPTQQKTTVLPNPPTNVSARATPPGDEAEAAYQGGGFRKWMEIENRRELAARKG